MSNIVSITSLMEQLEGVITRLTNVENGQFENGVDQDQINDLQNDLEVIRNNLNANNFRDNSQETDIDEINQRITDLVAVNTGQTVTDQDLINNQTVLQGYFSNNKLKLINFTGNGSTYSFLINDTDSTVKWVATVPSSKITIDSNLNAGVTYEFRCGKVPSSSNSLTNKQYVDEEISNVTTRLDTIEQPITLNTYELNEDDGTWEIITRVFSDISSAITFLTAGIKYGKIIYDFLSGARQLPNIRSYTQLVNEVDDIINEVNEGATATRITALETSQTTQDGKITALETSQTTQDTKITTLETSQTTQDTKITTLETSQTTQDTKITTLETSQTAQDTKITALETKTTATDTNVTALTTRVTGTETVNTTQNTALGTHDGRISALEALELADVVDDLADVRGAVSSLNDVLGTAGLIATGGLFSWLFGSSDGLGDVKQRLGDHDDAIEAIQTKNTSQDTSLGTNATNITNVGNRVTTLEAKNYVPTFTTNTSADQYKVLQLYYDNVTNPAIPVTKSKFDLLTNNNISDLAYSKLTGTPTNYWPTGSVVADVNGIIQLGNPATMKYGFSNIREPTANDHVATKNYVDTKVPSSLPISSLTASTITNSTSFGPMGNTTGRFMWTLGNTSRAVGTDTMYGFLYGDAYIGVNGRLGGLNAPNLDHEVANKWYVDSAITAIGGGSIAVNNILPSTITNGTTYSPTFGNDTSKFLMKIGSQATARVTAGQALVPAGKTSYAYGDAVISVNGFLNRINYPNGNSDCANKVYVDDGDYAVYDQVFKEIGHCYSAPGYDGIHTITPLFLFNLIMWLDSYDTTGCHFSASSTTAGFTGSRILNWIDKSPARNYCFTQSDATKRPFITGTGTLAYTIWEPAVGSYLTNTNFNVLRGASNTRYNGCCFFGVIRFRYVSSNQTIWSMDGGFSYAFRVDQRVGSTASGNYCPAVFAGGAGVIKFKNSASNEWVPATGGSNWYPIMICYSPQTLNSGDQQMVVEAWVDKVNTIAVGTVCSGMANSASSCTLGSLSGGTIDFFQGDIKELLFYDAGTFYGRPSTGQREAIFSQLKYKWGLGDITTL